jgi:hypothetical protein
MNDIPTVCDKCKDNATCKKDRIEVTTGLDLLRHYMPGLYNKDCGKEKKNA